MIERPLSDGLATNKYLLVIHCNIQTGYRLKSTKIHSVDIPLVKSRFFRQYQGYFGKYTFDKGARQTFTKVNLRFPFERRAKSIDKHHCHSGYLADATTLEAFGLKGAGAATSQPHPCSRFELFFSPFLVKSPTYLTSIEFYVYI